MQRKLPVLPGSEPLASHMHSLGGDSTAGMSIMRKPNGTRDVVTLADLAPRHDIKGGSGRRVFGDVSDERPTNWRHTMATTTKLKDLPPKSTSNVKGGRRID